MSGVGDVRAALDAMWNSTQAEPTTIMLGPAQMKRVEALASLLDGCVSEAKKNELLMRLVYYRIIIGSGRAGSDVYEYRLMQLYNRAGGIGLIAS